MCIVIENRDGLCLRGRHVWFHNAQCVCVRSTSGIVFFQSRRPGCALAVRCKVENMVPTLYTTYCLTLASSGGEIIMIDAKAPSVFTAHTAHSRSNLALKHIKTATAHRTNTRIMTPVVLSFHCIIAYIRR